MRAARSAATVGACVGAALLVALGSPASASADTAGADADDLARAVLADPGLLLGAQYVVGPPAPAAVAIVTTPTTHFPRSGNDYIVLSTGDALAGLDPSGRTDTGWTPINVNGIFDRTTLRIDFEVPAGANCLVGVDFQFFSSEYPDWVGSAFNDQFIIEADQSTWTATNGIVTAPDNIAFDDRGDPVTVNSSGATSMTAAAAAGTAFHGATGLLTAATPMTAGPHSLFLTIFDNADSALDSAIFLDDLRFGQVADVTTDCVPGAVAVAASAPTSPVPSAAPAGTTPIATTQVPTSTGNESPARAVVPVLAETGPPLASTVALTGTGAVLSLTGGLLIRGQRRRNLRGSGETPRHTGETP